MTGVYPLPKHNWRGARRAATLLGTVSLIAMLSHAGTAAADPCTDLSMAPPADLVTPTALFEALRARTTAQLLAIGLLRKPVSEQCAWIYEVKVLTASGSVVELDFGARDLDLVKARGPDNDRDAAALVRRFGGDPDFLTTGSAPANSTRSGEEVRPDDDSNGGTGGGSSSGSGGGDSDGSEVGGEGSEGGEGGGDSDGGEGDGDGGEGGGDSDSDSGEGGEDGGD